MPSQMRMSVVIVVLTSFLQKKNQVVSTWFIGVASAIHLCKKDVTIFAFHVSLCDKTCIKVVYFMYVCYLFFKSMSRIDLNVLFVLVLHCGIAEFIMRTGSVLISPALTDGQPVVWLPTLVTISPGCVVLHLPMKNVLFFLFEPAAQ